MLCDRRKRVLESEVLNFQHLCYDLSMTALLTDLRYAARMLRRNPGFAVLAIGALALGIGANSAIFAVINAVLLAPLPYADPHHLYEIGSADDHGTHGGSVADFVALRDRGGIFEKPSVDRFSSFTLTDSVDDAERVYVRALSSDMFALLGAPALIGRTFLADDFENGAPHVAVLAYRIWQRRYNGDRGVLGRNIQLDGERYTIVGVMPANFQFPINVYDLWLPWIFTNAELANRKDHGTIIYTRLRQGATPAQAQGELDSLAAAIASQFPDVEKDWHPRIEPAKLGFGDQYRTQLLVMLGAVGFVLLIACLNVANLLLARAESRRREIAVRIALGAGRWRLIRQMLTESLLLAGLGAIAGMLLASWGARALMAWFPVHAPRPKLEYTGAGGIVFAFAIGVSILAGVAFGLAPALQLSRERIHETLKTRRFRFRGILIVAETALCLILLAGAGLMIRSFAKLMEIQPGFRAENVLTIQVPMPSFLSAVTSFASRKEVETHQALEYQDLVDRVRIMPGVIAAGVGTVLPLGPMEVGTQAGFENDPNPQQDHRAQLRSVSPDYFRAMGIPLVEGRAFTDADAGSAPEVAIVNDALARKYWPHESAVGKHVNMSGLPRGPWYEVVGVVGGIHHRKLSDEPDPELYRPYMQYLGPAFGTVMVVRGSRDPAALAPSIRGAIRTLYPNQPIGEIKLMTQVVADSVAAPRFYTSLLATFAALALALGFAGIFGVLSYSVAQRARELGIRMALGATRPAVLKLVLGEGLLLVGIGIVAGIAGAAALTRLIQSQLYRTKPGDPATYAVVSLLMVMVALAAAWMPAARASRVDPIIALREE